MLVIKNGELNPITKSNIKVGQEIQRGGIEDYSTKFIITDILGDGKFKAVPKDVYEKANDYTITKKRSMPSFKMENVAGFVDKQQSFDISQKTTTQQGIKLTPEIKAMIRGEAPTLKKPSGASPFATKQLPTPEGLPKLPARRGTTSATSETTSGTLGKVDIEPQKTLPQKAQERLPDVPQETSLVKSPESVLKATYKGTVPQDVYTANREITSKKSTKVARIKESIKANLNSLGEGTDKLLGTISTRLKNIDPSLKKAIRDFEYNLANKSQADRRSVEPFLKRLSKEVSAEDYADLDLALKNGDVNKISEIVSKYGMDDQFKTVRSTLDDIYKRAEEVGYDIGYEKNYFPRMVEDSSGFLEYLGKGDDWSIIDEAIKAKETDIGRYLTVDEKASLVNSLVRGYGGKITLSETGAMKARRIEQVTPELNKFYRDSVDSLMRYIDGTNDAIEARRFFGKGKKTDKFASPQQLQI